MQMPYIRISDKVAEMIQQLIRDENLSPGDRLPSERQLSERFNVSRSPVREAIRALNSQGLLVTRRGGGTYVQAEAMTWTAQSIEPLAALINEDPHYRYDVLETRHTLEASTARLAALRATEEDKKKIKACFDIMLRHQQNGDSALSARADAQFHLAIAEASHNIVLLQVMRGLFDLVFSTVKENRQVMFSFDLQDNLHELTTQHEAIMNAIFAGDPLLAQQVMDQHLEFVQDSIRTSEDNEARQQRANRLSTPTPLL